MYKEVYIFYTFSYNKKTKEPWWLLCAKRGGWMVTDCHTCGAVDKICSECMELMKYIMKVRIKLYYIKRKKNIYIVTHQKQNANINKSWK